LALRDPALGVRAAVRLPGPILDPAALIRRAHRGRRPEIAHGHGGGRVVLLAPLPQQQPPRAPSRAAGVAVVRASASRPGASQPDAALQRLWRDRQTLPATPDPYSGAPAGGVGSYLEPARDLRREKLVRLQETVTDALLVGVGQESLERDPVGLDAVG